MTEINFEAFGAQKSAEAMVDAVNMLRTTINRVVDTVAGAKGGWQGDASDACGRAAAAFEGEASRVNAILQEIADLVGTGNKTYQDAETDNTELLTNLI
ncbi:WXG100 family type VII secretion target [Nocardia carnea]|uniref:WXG100 family type VII secretion target n=1 Tax=Nocardia carnea TaxID=37328 RepID=UPI002457162A|nr:WXG100 family type VII secretion target [Nocardia carnea]